MLPVSLYLLGDRGGIFAEVPGDLLKREVPFQRLLDEEPVFEGKVLLVSGYKVAHNSSFHCCQKEKPQYHNRKSRVNGGKPIRADTRYRLTVLLSGRLARGL